MEVVRLLPMEALGKISSGLPEVTPPPEALKPSEFSYPAPSPIK